jgi:hypothetical protein
MPTGAMISIRELDIIINQPGSSKDNFKPYRYKGDQQLNEVSARDSHLLI